MSWYTKVSDAVEKFFFEHAGAVILTLIAGIFVLVSVAAHQSNERKKAFMAQCLADLKEYECVAMWRGGSRRR